MKARFYTTIKEAAAFYRHCLRRAFSGKFATVVGWTGGLSAITLVIAWVTSPSAGHERTLLTAIPAAFFVGAFSLTLIIGIILAPFEIYRDERRAREAAEELRRPKFALWLPDTGTVNIALGGSTSESLAGTRQTMINSFRTDAVCLYCKNTGEVPLRNCRARVMSIRRASVERPIDLAFTESIELPWRKEDTTCLVIDLPPDETRRIWVGDVRSHGHFWIYRNLKDLPIESQQVFGPPGTYQLVIQVDGDEIAPVQLLLEVTAAEGPRPVVSGLWRGTAEVAILAQGSPTVEYADAGTQ